MARDNHVRIDRIDVCADGTNLVVNAGILALMQWWAAVLTRKGRTALAEIDELRTNDGMRAILGLRRKATAAWLMDWRGCTICFTD